MMFDASDLDYRACEDCGIRMKDSRRIRCRSCFQLLCRQCFCDKHELFSDAITERGSWALYVPKTTTR